VDLASRVTGTDDLAWFSESGRRTVEDFEKGLGAVGATLLDRHRILDFGCGCGRVELWMRELGSRAELHAVDIDAAAIAWANAHIPWAQFRTVAARPPLPYVDGYFDLVVNHSVFSHLDEAFQDVWLDELRRVAAPNALLYLSFHGDHAFEHFCTTVAAAGRDVASLHEERSSQGFLYLEDDGMDGPFPANYHTAFHTPHYVAEHWGGFFEVCAILERRALDYQDVVILRRRPNRP